MSFKDHFSGHAGAYARYRPGYPPQLFEYLASLTSRQEIAPDCATGSGQAATELARHYQLVVASDASVAQLRNAQPHARVAYISNLAEQPALKDRSVDLVVAAQAAHWFNHERFAREVRRVLRPEGALAIWTYGLACVTAQIDAIVRRFYEDVAGPYWPPERRHFESGYRDLPFPWRELSPPQFRLEFQWDLPSFIGYVGNWSAVQRYRAATGADPLPDLQAQIEALWNSDTGRRSVIWRLHLRVVRP